MTCFRAGPRMRLKLKSSRGSSRVQQSLAGVRKKLPELWSGASTSLALGQEHLARLALRRRLAILEELDSVATLVASQGSSSSLVQRIEAADRLLQATLEEVARVGVPPPRQPAVLDFDPVVEADLSALRQRNGEEA